MSMDHSTTLDSAPPRQVTRDRVAMTEDAITNDNGHLMVNAFLSRPGIFEYLASEIKPQWPSCDAVQAYPDDAILRAYRPPEELTKQKYLDSAKLLPVTDNHPPDMLHPDTVAGYPVGTSSEDVAIVDGKPRARLALWARKSIDGYRAGKKDISLGAYNRFVWGPGKTADGEPYDFTIVDTVNNHIAIVDAGRAGSAARIFDAAPNRGEKTTMKIDIKNATFDIDENAVRLIETERAESKATIDRLSGEIEVLKKRKPTEDEIAKLVDAEIEKRKNLEEMAKRKNAVKDAGFEVEGKSDDYISGIFDTLDAKPGDEDGKEGGSTHDAAVGFGNGKTEKITRDAVNAARLRVYR